MPPIPPTFDPDKPADNALAVAAELRAQFNALNDRIVSLEQANTDLQDVLSDLQNQINQRVTEDQMNNSTSGPANANNTFAGTFSDPPLQTEVEALAEVYNGLVQTLQSPHPSCGHLLPRWGRRTG